MAYLPRPAKRTIPRKPTSSQAKYKSAAWQRVRALKLQVDPVCEVHKSVGVLIDCTERMPIDHIIRIADNGAFADDRNLMTLCTTCHERKSNIESRQGTIIDWQYNEQGERIPCEGGRELIVNLLAKHI